MLIEEFISSTLDYSSFIRIKRRNARKIVGFRNRLIHAYDAIDSTMIWAIVKNHLPVLKQEVSQFLK